MLLKFELKPDHRNISNKALISDLKKVASELHKHAIGEREYQWKGTYADRTIIKRFGSWNKAVEAAGLEKTIVRNIPEEELFNNLAEVWTTLGRQPGYTEIHKPLSRFCAGPYENSFGSWRKALERFVEYMNNEGSCRPDRIVKKPAKDSIVKSKSKRKANLRLRWKVLQRDDFKCRACGRSPATTPGLKLEVDHIKAWANDGETVLENLQTLGLECNQGKSDLD